MNYKKTWDFSFQFNLLLWGYSNLVLAGRIAGDGEGGGVTILNSAGQLLTQWVVTGGPNNRPHGAHGIWVDRHGDIYVGTPTSVDKYVRN